MHEYLECSEAAADGKWNADRIGNALHHVRDDVAPV
jgi:hypothetical protein